jgi:actin related protein 2/3 complex subunit 2
MAMILLQPGHRSLGETVTDLLGWKPNELSSTDAKDQHRRVTKVFLNDFDNVHYKIEVKQGAYDTMTVSVYLPFLDDIMALGASDRIEQLYGGLVQAEPDENYSLTLSIPFDDYSDEKKQLAMAESLECIKANILGSVFSYFFEGVANREAREQFMFDLRPDTQVYFYPGADRCAVIFGIDFNSQFDKVLAQTFLGEFSEARRMPGLGGSPPVSFGENPTTELKAFGIEEPTGNIGFITFNVLSGHCSTPAKIAKISALLQGFRTYLQYHIKCAKSYFHSVMRKNTRELCKVLNRAKISSSSVFSTVEKVKVTGKNKGI